MNKDHSVVSEIASKYCISDSFVDCDGYSISSKGFLPTVVIQWSSELNSPIPVHFSLLIPKMFIFTLAISCLTTSNLPWFMALTDQVPMQYCFYSIGLYFHHQSHPHLGVAFALTLVSSFFLESFLHWSPIVYGYWLTWGVHLSVSYLFAFSYCSWGSHDKNSEVVCHPFSSGPHSVRPLHHDLSILGGPTGHIVWLS